MSAGTTESVRRGAMAGRQRYGVVRGCPQHQLPQLVEGAVTMDNRNAGERMRSLLLQLSLIVMTVVVAVMLFQYMSDSLGPVGAAAGS